MNKKQIIQAVVKSKAFSFPSIDMNVYTQGLEDMFDYLNPSDLQDREEKFKQNVAEFKGMYSSEMLRAFYNHWSQHGDNDRKMLFEKEKAFQVSKRLLTWKRNEERYSSKKENTSRPISTLENYER